MTCEHMDLLLAAYVDGMVEPDDRRDVEAHLRSCAACRADVAQQRATRAALLRSRAVLVDAPPPGLTTRLAAVLRDEQPASALPAWGFRLSAFAAAALVVLAVSAVALPVLTGRSTVVLAAQLALDHLKCFTIEPHDHGESVTVAEAEAELKQEYGWDLKVPPTGGSAAGRLIAVRRCLYGDGRAAHVLYSVDGQPVSLFILPGLQRPSETLSVFGQDEVVWTQEGRTYLLIGAAGLGNQLQVMASNLRNEAQ